MNSTVLYESYARGKKTIFRIRPTNFFKKKTFPWPAKLNKIGLFWTNKMLIQ